VRRPRTAGGAATGPATAAGYVQLLAWARVAAQGAPITWAVEGTRHYGLGLARHLGSQGQ